MSLEFAQGIDYCIQVIVSHRIVNKTDVVNVHGIQFLDVVIQFEQGAEDSGIRNARSVAQNTDLCIGEKLVTQGQDIIHYLRELRIGCGLAVTCKSKHVWFRAIGLHLG